MKMQALDLNKLNQFCKREIGRSGARVSLLVHDLTEGRDLISIEAGHRVVSASTIKTAIMLAAFRLVLDGKLSLSQTVRVPEEEVLDDTLVFDAGMRECSLEEMITWMIVNSDNTATNVLIDVVGMEAVNGFCASLGLKSTGLQRKMLDGAAVRSGRNNYTSAADQLLIYSALFRESILTPGLCGLAKSILLRQRDCTMALRYLCGGESVSFAHKTGGLDFLRHDAGIFDLPGQAYYFGCFVTGCMEESDENPVAERLIGTLSKAVYESFAAKKCNTM
ncbi:serine hydrolase [Caproiciproducens sp. NJN-50]|uniref:serine hydrolase n=1 Tax=Acutalibacteraceae TaxID=3082771 RepID=UPI000FFE1D00|nr:MULTISPECIES: serine hydrolase [Acutalibacteraceae]QAT48331.1 serine hydrolase [Caproiciproducens sp. NJN-50]